MINLNFTFLLGPVEQELDLYPDIVTYHTPFAQSIIGKEVNDTFTLEIEGKETSIYNYFN